MLKQQFNELINEKIPANKHQKSSILFLQRHDQSQNFWLKLVNNRQKAFTTLAILQSKKLVIAKIFTV